MIRPVIDPIRQSVPVGGSEPVGGSNADDSPSTDWLDTLDQWLRSLGPSEEQLSGFPPAPVVEATRPAVPSGWHVQQWRGDQWSTVPPAATADQAAHPAETTEAHPTTDQPDTADQPRSDQGASPASARRGGSSLIVRSARQHPVDVTPASGPSRQPVPTRPDTPPAHTPAAPCSCGLDGSGAAGNQFVGVPVQAADTPGIAVGRALTRRPAPTPVLPGRQPGITPD